MIGNLSISLFQLYKQYAASKTFTPSVPTPATQWRFINWILITVSGMNHARKLEGVSMF